MSLLTEQGESNVAWEGFLQSSFWYKLWGIHNWHHKLIVFKGIGAAQFLKEIAGIARVTRQWFYQYGAKKPSPAHLNSCRDFPQVQNLQFQFRTVHFQSKPETPTSAEESVHAGAQRHGSPWWTSWAPRYGSAGQRRLVLSMILYYSQSFGLYSAIPSSCAYSNAG